MVLHAKTDLSEIWNENRLYFELAHRLFIPVKFTVSVGLRVHPLRAASKVGTYNFV